MAPTSFRPASWALYGVLALCLLMFGQTCQYLIDIYPLYLLSKIWPLLTLPLCGWALMRLQLPYRGLLVTTIVWVLAVTPFLGIVNLGNSLSDAVATTVKAWCFTTPFSCAALLVLLRPSPRMVRQVLLGLGIGLFAFLVVVWISVPTRVYDMAGDTKLFMYDDERGYHLFMPMFFGQVLIFALNRSFWIRKTLWKLVAIGVCVALMLVIYKERATIAGTLVMLVLGTVFSLRRWRPVGLALLGVAGCLGALLIAQHLQSAGLGHNLGGSLSVRRNSIASALDYLSANPLRWILGVGSTSRVGDVSLANLLHNQMFFLADIGWLGVVFEYGIIGAVLIAWLHLAAWRVAQDNAGPNDAVALALVDYVIYVLVTSPIYSVMFVPGEIMTCMAVAWYLGVAMRRQPPATRPVPNPAPRIVYRPGYSLRGR